MTRQLDSHLLRRTRPSALREESHCTHPRGSEKYRLAASDGPADAIDPCSELDVERLRQNKNLVVDEAGLVGCTRRSSRLPWPLVPPPVLTTTVGGLVGASDLSGQEAGPPRAQEPVRWIEQVGPGGTRDHTKPRGGRVGQLAVTVEQALDALRIAEAPKLRRGIVRLGMVREVRVARHPVRVTTLATTSGGVLKERQLENAHEAILAMATSAMWTWGQPI